MSAAPAMQNELPVGERRRAVDRLSSWVCFVVEQQVYGLPIDSVQEVLNDMAVEPVPGTSTVVVGVINLRGNVVTVLDLRERLLRRPHPGRHDRATTYCIVVIRLGGELFGLCVDAVAEVMKVSGGEIKAAPSVGDNQGVARAAGLVSRRDHLLTLLEPDSLLDGLRFIA